MTIDTQVPSIAIRHEARVQTIQCLYHLSMAFFMGYTMFDKLYSSTVENDIEVMEGYEVYPPSVLWIYSISFIYNMTLYFWDPVVSSRIKPRHLMIIITGTLLGLFSYYNSFVALLFFTYILDIYDLVHLNMNIPDNNRLVVSTMTKIHHMVTLFLLMLSWTSQLCYCGIFVLFIHDVTDVPMFVIRIIRKQQKNMLTQILTVVILIISWVYYRIFHFVDFLVMLHDIITQYEAVNPLNDITGNARICLYFLTILLLFNIYWTYLVSYKAIIQLKYGYTSIEEE